MTTERMDKLADTKAMEMLEGAVKILAKGLNWEGFEAEEILEFIMVKASEIISIECKPYVAAVRPLSTPEHEGVEGLEYLGCANNWGVDIPKEYKECTHGTATTVFNNVTTHACKECGYYFLTSR